MNLKKQSSERLSQWLLYLLLGVIVLVFAGFYFIGFEAPFASNPDFNAPLLTDVVLILVTILLFVTILVSIASAANAVRKRNNKERIVNGIPARKIRLGVGVGVLVVLLLTALFGGTTTMRINGEPYNDRLWLRMADMLVDTSLVLLGIGLCAIVFGYTRYYRRKIK